MDFKGIPKVPGIYMIRYETDQSCYIGATRNLRKRIREHLTLFGDSSWKQNLCKQLISDQIPTLRQAFAVVKSQLSYEVLFELEINCSSEEIREKEYECLMKYKPSLNFQKTFSNYGNRDKN